MSEKTKYLVEVFEWQFGKRVVHEEHYTYAYSIAQAIRNALHGKIIPDEYSINCQRVA